jgi:hypothetical protein
MRALNEYPVLGLPGPSLPLDKKSSGNCGEELVREAKNFHIFFAGATLPFV